MALIIVFMLSLLNSITTKMNQGSSQSLMNSTRMIQSSISSELENDMEQIESSASLFVMSGGEKDAAKTLANYAAATEFFRFYYIDLNGTGINSDGERVMRQLCLLKKLRFPRENAVILMPMWGIAGGFRLRFRRLYCRMAGRWEPSTRTRRFPDTTILRFLHSAEDREMPMW